MTSQDTDTERLFGTGARYELVDRRPHAASVRATPSPGRAGALDARVAATIEDPDLWVSRPELGLLMGLGVAYAWAEDPRVWQLVGAQVRGQAGAVFELPEGVTLLDGRLAPARVELADGCALVVAPDTVSIGRATSPDAPPILFRMPDALLSIGYEPWVERRLARWRGRAGALAQAVQLGLVQRFGDLRGGSPRGELAAMTSLFEHTERVPALVSPPRAAVDYAEGLGERFAHAVLASMVPRIVDWVEGLDRLVDEVSNEGPRAHDTALALRLERDDLECARVVLAAAGHDRACSNVLRAIDEMAYDRMTTLQLAAGAPDEGLAHVGAFHPDLWWGDASAVELSAWIHLESLGGIVAADPELDLSSMPKERPGASTPRVFLYDVNLDGLRSGRDGTTSAPSYEPEGTAMLHGHRLAFADFSARWDGATATVVPDALASVPGVVLPVSEYELANLDSYFGHPFHYRRTVRTVVYRDGATVEAFVYGLPEERLEAGAPSAKYLEILRQAYERLGFDRATLAKAAEAASTPTPKRRP